MSNVKTITRAPDATTKIITLDMQGDGLQEENGRAFNIEIIVDGEELRGIAFTIDGTDPLQYTYSWQSILLTLRTASEADTCVVKHRDSGTTDEAKINVTGSVFADGLLTRTNAIGVWSYKSDVGTGHYCTDLALYVPAP